MLNIPNTFYNQPRDQFAFYLHGYPDWRKCREQIQDLLTESKQYFLFGTNNPQKVIKFITRIQKRMKLDQKQQLEFVETNNPRIVAMKLTPFWKQKHSFSALTILLRAGNNYNRSMLKAIKKSKYLRSKKTYEAMNRFTKGYVELLGLFTSSGWSDHFSQYSNPSVLVKP